MYIYAMNVSNAQRMIDDKIDDFANQILIMEDKCKCALVLSV